MTETENHLYDINTVCNMLGTTSRALRFYEEKQIVASTKIPETSRRQYTEEQIDVIRNVLLLRSIGLSVREIYELQQENIDLKSAVLSRRAQIITFIEGKQREINLLSEALSVIESGGDLYQMRREDLSVVSPESDPELLQLSRKCAEAIVFGDTPSLYAHLSDKIKRSMPPKIYEKIRLENLAPLGDFIEFEHISTDKKHTAVMYQQHIRYQKFGLKIKFFFQGKTIVGLWFSYYD